MKKLKFDELSLSREIQHAIADMEFTEATRIQSETIPLLLQGEDVIGQAQTGTGKTVAFGIPLLEMINSHAKGISAVVMCPTRELSNQVANELKKLGKYKKDINVLAVYGGESIERQIKELRKGVQIVTGTPGRIIDHLERKTISFDKVKFVVLDEADEMLNMGFREDIENILSRMPPIKQTALFSATMPKPILDIVHKYQRSPKLVKVTTEKLTAANIKQVYFETTNSAKVKIISLLMHAHNLKLVLVFCNTKRRVDDLVKTFKSLGQKTEALHGGLTQNQRNGVLAGFKKGEIKILVATDVAARGIHVSNVDAVINYDLPLDPEYYVHRIGRTGRAGESGLAFSFVTGRNETYMLRDIERYAQVQLEKTNPPSEHEIAEMNKVQFIAKVKNVLAKSKLEKFEAIVNELALEGYDSHRIAAALLKLFMPEEPKFEKEVREEKHESNFQRGERHHSDRNRSDRNRTDRNRSDRNRSGRNRSDRSRTDRNRTDGNRNERSFGRTSNRNKSKRR